jgi:hypothetical protein
MPPARTASRSSTPLAAAALLGALVLAALLAAGCGGGGPAAPVVAPSGAHPAAGSAGDAPAVGPPAWTAADASDGADRLEAARTVSLYCHLVEGGQFARAGELCSGRPLWSRRKLGGLRRFHFRSARVFAAPDARTLVLKARVRVLARRGCPLPDSLAIVFFTLGRVGSAVGGWLITSVSTSP